MCTDSMLLTIFRIINILIQIIRFGLPLLIIILLIMDIGKVTLSSGEINYKDTITKSGIRILSAVLIFYVPTVVNIIFKAVDNDYSKNNLGCLLNVTTEDIQSALLIEADEYLTKLEEEYNADLYNSALNAITQILDEDIKMALTERLVNIKNNQESKIVGSIKNNNLSSSKILMDAATNRFNTLGVNISGIPTYTNIKYYYQCDPNYKSISYGNGKTYNTCYCGCGFTSLAMVIDGLTGSTNTPIGIVNTFQPSTYAVNGCPIADATLINDKITTKYGVKPTKLFNRENHASDEEIYNRKQKIVSALEKGNAVILLIPGHYITLGSIDSNGKIALYDPGNQNRNGYFTIDEIYNNYKDYDKRCSSGKKGCGFIMAISYEGKNN